MGKRGPSPKPRLEVVREGNPSKTPLREEVQLPPGAPGEPDWRRHFPSIRTPKLKAEEHKLAREVASEEWRRVVPVLDRLGLISEPDLQVLEEHCICVARILLAERDISRNGIWTRGERGAVKNPAVTAANQYRVQLRYTIDRLGLSPGSRSRMSSRGEAPRGQADDPFDV